MPSFGYKTFSHAIISYRRTSDAAYGHTAAAEKMMTSRYTERRRLSLTKPLLAGFEAWLMGRPTWFSAPPPAWPCWALGVLFDRLWGPSITARRCSSSYDVSVCHQPSSLLSYWPDLATTRHCPTTPSVVGHLCCHLTGLIWPSPITDPDWQGQSSCPLNWSSTMYARLKHCYHCTSSANLDGWCSPARPSSADPVANHYQLLVDAAAWLPRQTTCLSPSSADSFLWCCHLHHRPYNNTVLSASNASQIDSHMSERYIT